MKNLGELHKMDKKIEKIINDKYFSSESELEHFGKITEQLIDVMVDYSTLTLNTLIKKKGVTLNDSQVLDVINFCLQFILQQIQDPEFLDIVREETSLRYFSKT